MIDIEKLTSDYLRAQPAVAAIVGRRVVGKTPGNTTDPWVRVLILSAPTDPAGTEHLIGYLLQMDAYAGARGGQPEATDLALAVRAALHAMPSAAHAGAVVTASSLTGWLRLPDNDFEESRERFVITSLIHAHPTA